MTELTNLFDQIARKVYGNPFLWSDYNKSQWEKFTTGGTSWCGSCAFSAEADGEVPQTSGFGLGGVTGPFPFHLWDLTGHFGSESLRAAVAALGKYSLDRIG